METLVTRFSSASLTVVRVFVCSLTALCATMLFAANLNQRLDSSAMVIRNMTASHQIPGDVLSQAQCVAIFPTVAGGGVIVGGKHGNGVVSCRTSAGWSSPAFVTITGGSVGLQAGLEHQDIVLLMNKQGEQELNAGHWDLGAEAASAAANTKSSNTVESNDWKTPVISYVLSSGAYVSASVAGTKISVDDDAMHEVYGQSANLQAILNGQVQTPASAQAFLTALSEVARK